MKRLFACIVTLAVVLAASGCAKQESPMPDRGAVLPDAFVSSLAGAPMKLTLDRHDAKAHYTEWAWEEAGGTPKLLYVEIWSSPADCDTLYTQATGADVQTMNAPDGAQACRNDRAVFMRTGDYYIRIVTLGFSEDEDALSMLVSRLAYETAAAR
jgi:hypothetical protein